MVRFYKYYKKDSATYTQSRDKKYKKELDSTWKAERKQRRLIKKLTKKGIPLPKEFSKGDTLQKQFAYWHAVMKDSTVTDSVRAIAKEKVKALALERARQYPGYQLLVEKYKIYGDTATWDEVSNQVPGLDTLKGVFDRSPAEIFEQSGKIAEQNLSKFGGATGAVGDHITKMNDLTNLPDQYKKQYAKYLDKDKLVVDGKEKIAEEAKDYFDKHPEALVSAQSKVSKLLSKYRVFSSDNLSDAKKQSSLEGKTFFERMVIGGNFNLVSTKPVSIDLSPDLGFRFTSKLSMGVGINYRYTFGDSIKNSWYVSPRNTGFKAFVTYDFFKNFYAYAETNYVGLTSQSSEGSERDWITNYFLGLGRKFLIHPKLYMTITATYNLNNMEENPLYINHYQVRVGFRLSELATRKKMVYYNPNR